MFSRAPRARAPAGPDRGGEAVRDPGDPTQSAAQSGLLAPIIARSPWYLRIPLEAFAHFLASDGWAIASYIAFAVLAANGVESLRIGLNRAYDVMETRAWWLLRAESVFYVLVSAIALLVVAVLVVLAPLLLETAARYAHWLEPLDRLGTVTRLAAATVVLVAALVLLHLYLPAG